MSTGFATILIAALNYLQSIDRWFLYPALTLTMIFSIGFIASIGFIIVRYRWRLLIGFANSWLSWQGARRVGERILVVGSDEASRTANWWLKHGGASRIISVVGTVADEQPGIQDTWFIENGRLGGPAFVDRMNFM